MEPQHGEAEVFPHRAIDPAGPQDPGTGKGQSRQLSRSLG
jgi:hypothetical protein